MWLVALSNEKPIESHLIRLRQVRIHAISKAPSVIVFYIPFFFVDRQVKRAPLLGRRKDRKPEALQAFRPRLLPSGLGLQVSSAVDHRDQRRSNASEQGRPARGAQLGVPRVHEDNVRERARAPTVLSISVSSYEVQ